MSSTTRTAAAFRRGQQSNIHRVKLRGLLPRAEAGKRQDSSWGQRSKGRGGLPRGPAPGWRQRGSCEAGRVPPLPGAPAAGSSSRTRALAIVIGAQSIEAEKHDRGGEVSMVAGVAAAETLVDFLLSHLQAADPVGHGAPPFLVVAVSAALGGMWTFDNRDL